MQPPGALRVSVVIPVLNDATGLRRCLASLRNNAVPSAIAEVIVVDNGSADGSSAVAREAGACVLESPGLRVGQLRNQGAAVARGQILAFVDADHEIVSGWVEAACRLLAERGVGGAGAAYLAPAGGTWVQRMYSRLRSRPPGRCDVEWLGSGNLAVRRDVFTELGGFDTRLEVCEDVDLCQRIQATGWRLVSDERLGSIHHGDPATLGALFRSELWRGRDNLRVSLRRLTLRGLPSVVIPLVDLACLAVISLSLAVAGWSGLWLAAGAALVVATSAVLRAARLLRSPGSSGPLAWIQAFSVAITYDVARALALAFRTRHRRSR
ncbi:MAG: glycosyltransferase [Acidobacteria bacterium]|nr:glycosyltransferase [Acidobacteriota bacterium]